MELARASCISIGHTLVSQQRPSPYRLKLLLRPLKDVAKIGRAQLQAGNFSAQGNSRYQSSAEKFARPSPDRVVPPLETRRRQLLRTDSMEPEQQQ